MRQEHGDTGKGKGREKWRGESREDGRETMIEREDTLEGKVEGN